jgi:hypothetical protein
MKRFGPPLLLVSAVLAACGSTGDSTTHEPARSITAHGVGLQLQPGWHVSRSNLTPKLVNPRDLVSVGTFSMRPGGRCAQSPSRAYSDMGSTDGLITIMERGGNSGDYPPRPARFHLNPRPRSFECAPARLSSQELMFSDGGRNFYAFVALGSGGPVGEAESILDSFDTTGHRD